MPPVSSARQALTEEKDREFALQLQEIEQLDERADVREPQSQPSGAPGFELRLRWGLETISTSPFQINHLLTLAPPGSTLAVGGGGGGGSKRLPFVFDQMLECVQTAAYIGSSKVRLRASASTALRGPSERVWFEQTRPQCSIVLHFSTLRL